MFVFENEVQPEKFSSIPTAMWWGMATLTTVGYGDVAPVTPMGQLFGIITMIIGIGMFALPTGIIATGFANEMEKLNFVVNWKLVSKVPFFMVMPLIGFDPTIIAVAGVISTLWGIVGHTQIVNKLHEAVRININYNVKCY